MYFNYQETEAALEAASAYARRAKIEWDIAIPAQGLINISALDADRYRFHAKCSFDTGALWYGNHWVRISMPLARCITSALAASTA